MPTELAGSSAQCTPSALILVHEDIDRKMREEDSSLDGMGYLGHHRDKVSTSTSNLFLTHAHFSQVSPAPLNVEHVLVNFHQYHLDHRDSAPH